MEQIRNEPLKYGGIGVGVILLASLLIWGPQGCGGPPGEGGEGAGQGSQATAGETSEARGDGAPGSSSSSSENEEASGGESEQNRGEASEGTNPDGDAVSPDDGGESGDVVPGESGDGPNAEDGPESQGSPPPNRSSDGSPPNPAGNEGPESGKEDAEEADDDKMQLSLKQAKIDEMVQWLAETTGKSVIKHPQVRCQLTILSPGKVSKREALNMVYQALAMEGYKTIESSNSVMIVPKGEDAQMMPRFVQSTDKQVSDGRERVMKVFELEHVEASELKRKIQGVLSDEVKIEADEHANKLIVTDYAENIGLLEDLVNELDVLSVADQVVEIFELEHAEAEGLAELVESVLNGTSGSDGPRSRGRGNSGGSGEGGESVHLWPDPTANRIIAKTPKSRVDEVGRLIETLDVAEPADIAVRVLPLRHVEAEDLVEEIGPLYQKMSGSSLKEQIEVTANSRSNSLIILSSKEHFESIEQLVASLDTEKAQQKVLRTFELENADAQDVADQLETLYDSGSSTSSRYVYYYGRSSGDEKEMNVVADQRRNSVVVQAAPGAMDSIADMIDELDQAVSDESLAPRIFPLQYVNAVDVEQVLKEIFNQQEEERSYFSYYYSNNQSDQSVGRLSGKVRITAEPNRNAIIVTSNSGENLDAVASIIEQLDVPSERETTLRIRLNFASSIKVANSLNVLFAEGGSPPMQGDRRRQNERNQQNQQQDGQDSNQSNFTLVKETTDDSYFPWLGGQQQNRRTINGQTVEQPVSELIGRVRCVPDQRSNSILLTSSVHFLPQMIDLIKEMDAPTPQVMIEARIIEVAADFRERLGVRYAANGEVFNNDALDGSVQPGAGVDFFEIFTGSGAQDALREGVIESDVNLDALIQFLRKNTDSKILAKPQINVADNELGRLFVGAQVPFIENSRLTESGSRDETFSYRDVGIILEVTPHIHNNDEVALRIRAESSNIRSGETLFGGFILDTRDFRTDLMVKSGETIILGGIIQEEEVDTVRKVPLLGDIPGLGWAFKHKDQTTRRSELMVFLKPEVTRSPTEAKKLSERLGEQSPAIKEWQKNRDDDKSGIEEWMEESGRTPKGEEAPSPEEQDGDDEGPNEQASQSKASQEERTEAR